MTSESKYIEELERCDVITIGPIKLRLLFFDSLGAKCSSIMVYTPDVSILVDPGAAGMQPSFPLPQEEKAKLREKAYERIYRYGASADVVVITHYHYDHHVHPDRLNEMIDIFKGKVLFIKDPNQWINESQRKRALKFLSKLHGMLGGEYFVDLLSPPKFKPKEDFYRKYPKTTSLWEKAGGKKLKVYQAKKRWFSRITKKWKAENWIGNFEVGNTKVMIADGKKFKFGETEIKFSEPMFHGQFLDNVGWIIGLTVKYESTKLLFTSDLQGPIIEEYADWIVDEKPNFIIADGPPIYTYGFMIGKEEIIQVVKNMQKIIYEAKPQGIIWDHHLCRGPFRSKIKKVLTTAEKAGVRLCTAAEQLGRKPLIEQLNTTIL
ncbi:MBL fold metallo-hydrolase [Candidatus Bathyarchaeota archaeon]|nr:MBL fold metallo-hydrolase [Candidatus Bathyarchaeota archaeon]